MSSLPSNIVRRRCARCLTVFRRDRGTRRKYCGDDCQRDAVRELTRLRNREYRERLRAVPVAV